MLKRIMDKFTGFGMYLTSKTHEYEKDILRVVMLFKTGYMGG